MNEKISEVNIDSKKVERDREEDKKTRGRKKTAKEAESENMEQTKFFIDVSKDNEAKEMITKLLLEANKKSFGREIILKDLILVSLPKITQKDLEKIQEGALTDMEKIERLLIEHNEKNKTYLSLGEFLVKKLNI